MVTSKTAAPELRLTRVLNAPRKLVWDAWTRAEHVSKWLTPAPMTTPKCEVDFRAGGVFSVTMRMPNGVEHPFNARLTEIVPQERLVFVGMVHDDNEATTTVTFEDLGAKTRLSVHQTYSFESDATRGAEMGWTQTLKQLEQLVTAT